MCCGSSRAVGLAPKTSILLGNDDGSAARYVKINDGNLIPGNAAGAQIYVRGSSVQQAIDEGKLEDVSREAIISGQAITMFRVTVPGQEPRDFPSYTVARQYSSRNNGSIEVIRKADK